MTNQRDSPIRRSKGILTIRRTIDLVFIVLAVVGVLFLIQQLVYNRSEREIYELLGKILGYTSLPLGLAIKFFTWVQANKKKIDSRFELLNDKVDINTNKLEVQLAKQLSVQNNLDQLEDRLLRDNRELDIRMNRLEAKQEVSISVGETRQQVVELSNRFASFLQDYASKNKPP